MKISLFYDHVTVLDYAYLDDHLGALGHSLVVGVEFIGRTDDEGVVFDFSRAKSRVKEIIDRDCDHRLVVPKGVTTKLDDDMVEVNFMFCHQERRLYYKAPAEAICEIPHARVCEENLQAYLEDLILSEMPDTVYSVKLKFTKERPVRDQQSFFHYTHGLKQHFGNCQRLWHGHRSTVDVFVNGERRSDLEKYLCTQLFQSSIHFCFWENVVNKSDFASTGESFVGRPSTKAPFVHIKYESNQGVFESKVPSELVYITETETTVENLSTMFANIIREKASDSTVQVNAYEGIAKGATTTLLS